MSKKQYIKPQTSSFKVGDTVTIYHGGWGGIIKDAKIVKLTLTSATVTWKSKGFNHMGVYYYSMLMALNK